MPSFASLRPAAFAAILAVTALTAAPASAQSDMSNMAPKTVGGAPMYANKTIVENAVNSRDHTTLVAAVKAAGLVDTLSGPGPFTVFAPTNAAFRKLPAGTVASLLQPANKDKLTGVLTYHVVPGRLDGQALVNRIARGGGSAKLKTASGGTLTVTQLDNRTLGITDENGNTARTGIFDVYQSNGVIHVVDQVLLPM